MPIALLKKYIVLVRSQISCQINTWKNEKKIQFIFNWLNIFGHGRHYPWLYIEISDKYNFCPPLNRDPTC